MFNAQNIAWYGGHRLSVCYIYNKYFGIMGVLIENIIR